MYDRVNFITDRVRLQEYNLTKSIQCIQLMQLFHFTLNRWSWMLNVMFFARKFCSLIKPKESFSAAVKPEMNRICSTMFVTCAVLTTYLVFTITKSFCYFLNFQLFQNSRRKMFTDSYCWSKTSNKTSIAN